MAEALEVWRSGLPSCPMREVMGLWVSPPRLLLLLSECLEELCERDSP